jgi:hypothetical protein
LSPPPQAEPRESEIDEPAKAEPAGAVGWADVLSALTAVRPSALREVELRIPTVTWDDIGGQAALKQALREVPPPPGTSEKHGAQFSIRMASALDDWLGEADSSLGLKAPSRGHPSHVSCF